jgi:tetratricopeptide (TPR) repeat protein
LQGLALASCTRRVVPEAPAVGAALPAADPAQALDRHRAAVERDPSDVPAHLRYVAEMLAQGRRSEVRAWYEERSRSPSATDAERTMAERLSTNGASTPLRRVYTAAAERSPSVAWWRVAVAEVEIAEADAWNRRRIAAIDRRDTEEEKKAFLQATAAVRRAERALALAESAGPDLPEVDLYRGHLRAVEGDLQAGAQAKAAAYAAAATAFARATARRRDLVEAWAGLGDVRYRTGDLRESLEAWREAVTLSPSDAYYRESLGVVLHQIGRHTEAAEQYAVAAQLDPRSASPLLKMGDAWADAERWQPALEAYRDALRRDPAATEAHYRAAIVLEHLGRITEARAAYERYVAADGPRSASVRRRIERLLRVEQQR